MDESISDNEIEQDEEINNSVPPDETNIYNVEDMDESINLIIGKTNFFNWLIIQFCRLESYELFDSLVQMRLISNILIIIGTMEINFHYAAKNDKV